MLRIATSSSTTRMCGSGSAVTLADDSHCSVVAKVIPPETTWAFRHMGALDKAECRRAINSVGTSLNRQLQEDAFCMRFDSLGSNTQMASDPLVRQPIAHQANNHAFPNG